MNIINIIHTINNSNAPLTMFGWLVLAVVCFVGVAYLLSNLLAPMICVDFSTEIEKLDAEIASERVASSRREAFAARCETFAALATYCPIWETEERTAHNLSFLRNADAITLESLKGIGQRRSRKILDAGDAITEQMLWKICGSKVAHNLLWASPLGEVG